MSTATLRSDGRHFDAADVAIVGHGPVGQVLALLLAQHGWRVLVLEKQPAPYPRPRAVSFDGPAARILADVGVAGAIAEYCEPTPDYFVENGAGQTLLHMPLRPVGRYGRPDSTSVHQPGLEAALIERGAGLPGLRVLRGRQVVGLVSGESEVDLVTRHVASGERKVHMARWVVGCDGANSLVRDAIGASLSGPGFGLDWLACDVVPHRPPDFPPRNLQIADPARPRVAVSAGPGHRRWEFMRLPGEDRGRFATRDNAWRLLTLFGVTPDNATLERHAVYTIGAAGADRWRKGRVLLAGDAAHQMPPFAGQGMCSGIRDAANLAWKLHLVLAGMADEALLDSYEREQRPRVQGMIDLSVWLGRVICQTDPSAAARRDAVMTAAERRMEHRSDAPHHDALTAGFLLTGPDGRPEPLAGLFIPQATVRGPLGSGLLDDVVGRGFRLIVGDEFDAPSDLFDPCDRDLLDRLTVRVVHVRPAGSARPVPDGGAVVTVLDERDVYLPWLSELGAGAVLVRPDHHVFGGARDRDGVRRLFEELHRQLLAPHAEAAERR
ncbi:bifunctional 3-(3-hydroxy-phenyl)propionate/3-hydroxycinnamic acid hydroxylase [Streptomyces afghaniensis]|uniref:bifunctional 3-(3-hydroxy-phenyl)propionate/3-hydroxycinnamic acid hydroxylase MhpA n=1 Tax=Streptomyces afghaniensis TaxID=66865 RepID=UPI0033A9DF23